MIPDLPLQDPEAGFEERIRPALKAVDRVHGRLVIVGHSQGTASKLPAGVVALFTSLSVPAKPGR